MKIVTLTLCPALDIHCRAHSLELNHENIASVISRDAGGKGVNISRALTLFGVDNIAIVALGEQSRDSFCADLRADGISFIPIVSEGRIRENITVHTDDGRETRISFEGDGATDSLMAEVESLTDKLCEEGSVLTLTGRLPNGVDMEDVKAYIRRLKSRGVKVVIDSRSFSFSDLIEVKPFLIKPNEEEIRLYSSREISDASDAANAAEELRRSGIENVMVTLGSLGAVIASEEGIYHASAPSIEAKSTIGAGDSSIAGFLMAYSEKVSIGECLRRAVSLGSAACMSEGTRPPSPDAVSKIIPMVYITRMQR